MATPTRPELVAQLKAIIHILQEVREFGNINAENWVDLEDALVQTLEGDNIDTVLNGTKSQRSSLASILVNTTPIEGHLLDWPKFLDKPSTAIQEIITDIYDDFVDNSETVLTRDITFAAAPAVVGTGTGTMVRHTVDAKGFDIEACFPEAKTAECIIDQSTGTEKSKEVFRFLGGEPGPDPVEFIGSGQQLDLSALYTTDSLLINSGFDDFTGSDTLPSGIPSWTSSVDVIGDGTDYTFNDTDTYLPAPNDATTVYSLNIKLSRTLSQKLSESGAVLEEFTPYHLVVPYNASVGSAVGDLTITMGTHSGTVAVSGATPAGWNLLSIPLTSACWYENFKEDDLDITIDWAKTSGEILIDDVIFAPFSNFDGLWYMLLAGATPFLLEDKFSWTDSEVGAIIQYWFWRLFGRYLPHSATPTITDP